MCLLLIPLRISAESRYKLVIDDREDLLTDSEEKMLQVKMDEIREFGNVGFVTVAQYADTGSYARGLYRELFGTESGFLFIIDMGRRNIWIYSDGAIYRVINKSYANTITDNVYRYASKGDYYSCAYNVYDQALTLLRGGKISQPMKYISNALIGIVMALLANFVYLTIERSEETVSPEKMAAAMTSGVIVSVVSKKMVKSRKTRHVESSGGGGGGYSGGGGGGGGGGGSSGGGGGHSF